MVTASWCWAVVLSLSTYVESVSFSFFRIPKAFLVRFFNPVGKQQKVKKSIFYLKVPSNMQVNIFLKLQYIS